MRFIGFVILIAVGLTVMALPGFTESYNREVLNTGFTVLIIGFVLLALELLIRGFFADALNGFKAIFSSGLKDDESGEKGRR